MGSLLSGLTDGARAPVLPRLQRQSLVLLERGQPSAEPLMHFVDRVPLLAFQDFKLRLEILAPFSGDDQQRFEPKPRIALHLHPPLLVNGDNLAAENVG